MKLLNEKVLIKLDEHKEHTSTPTDLLVPLYDNIETDGGRPGVKISAKKYLSQGTVVDISKSAATLLDKDGITVTPGTRVFVNTNAVSPSYQYFTNRDSLVINFDGHILIPVVLIDSIHE